MHTKSLSIVLAGGILFGILIGYTIGHQSTVKPSASSLRGDTDERSGATADLARNELPFSNGNGGTRNRALWSKQVVDLYANVESGKPTPGFATLFKEAIDRGEPYSQGSVLMLIEGIRQEDLPQALSLMKRAGKEGKFRGAPGPGQQSMVWLAFWNRFGELDPQKALVEVRDLGDVEYFGKDMAEKNIFHGWAKRDPAAAAQGFLQSTDLLVARYAVRGVTYEWAMVDIPAATRWTNENLTEDIKANAFCSMAYAVVNRDGFEEGINWWRQITDEASRRMVFVSLQDITSRRGPGVSLEERVAMITAGRDLGFRDERLESNVAAAFLSKDPASGAELFTQFPSTENPQRYERLNRLLNDWTRKDVVAAAQWVDKQRSEPWYDSAVTGLAYALGETDLTAAQSWAATVQDEKLRQQTLNGIEKMKALPPKQSN